MKEEVPEKTTSSPRTREASTPYLLGNRQAASDQLKEDTGGARRNQTRPYYSETVGPFTRLRTATAVQAWGRGGRKVKADNAPT